MSYLEQGNLEAKFHHLITSSGAITADRNPNAFKTSRTDDKFSINGR